MAKTAWRVEDFRDDRGNDVILDFIYQVRRGQGPDAVTRIIRVIRLLRDFGLGLSTDHLHRVRGDADLWSLRANWRRNAFRFLLYNPAGNTLVLLEPFIEQSEDPIPASSIERARARMAIDLGRRT